MKWLVWFAVTLPLVMIARADLLSFSDFDFTAQPKIQDKEVKNTRDMQKQDSHWAYEVTADNKSVRDYADLEFRYVIFRKQAMVGNKSGASKMVRKEGVAKTPAITAHGRFNFTTEPILIEKTQLNGGWVWGNGANPRDWDVLAGIWIKVFAGGKQVGEFTAPQGLENKEKWDKPAK